jgi:hypothetical protein
MRGNHLPNLAVQRGFALSHGIGHNRRNEMLSRWESPLTANSSAKPRKPQDTTPLFQAILLKDKAAEVNSLATFGSIRVPRATFECLFQGNA